MSVRQVCPWPCCLEVYLSPPCLQLFPKPYFRWHKGVVTNTNQDLQEQTTTNASLREQLEAAKKETSEKGSVCFRFTSFASTFRYMYTDDCQAELQQELENLRRENDLIASAWYDMTSRLQSNTVILQRRAEAPKSWLGKQRVVVGGAASAVRSSHHILRLRH